MASPMGSTVHDQSYRWLGYFLPWATVVVLLAAYFYHGENRHELERLETLDSAATSLGADTLTRGLRGVGEEVLILAGDSDLRELLDRPDAARLASLGADYQNIVRTRRTYDQLRWIDETGQERVRVNAAPAGAVLVPAAQLQKKADRYYFAATMALKPGGLYLSPLDLNIENGRIEVPIKPMIRIATPVSDSRGQSRGIVIINYLAEELLARFRSVTGGSGSRTVLLNGEGFWLASPKRDEEWGFMYKRTDTFAGRYPAAWAAVRAADRGHFVDEQGMWTFATVVPVVDVGGVVEAHVETWKVVTLLPADELRLIRLRDLPQTLVVTAVALLIILFGSWRLAATRARQIEAEEQLRRSNVDLEHSVAERTSRLRAEVAERQLAEHRYRESSEQYQRILATMHDGYWLNDKNGAFLDVNRAACEMLGYSRDELLKLRIADIEAIESAGEVRAHMEEIKLAGYDRFESQHRRKDGSIIDVEVSVALMTDYGRYVAIVRDISERKRTEAERRLASLVLDNTDEGVLVCGADLRVRSVNPAFSRITGFPAEAIIGKSPAMLNVSPEGVTMDAFAMELMRQLQKEGSWRGELRSRRRSGELYPVWLNVSVVRDVRQRIELYVAVFSDITTIKESQERLNYLAHHDALTGLPNRLLFNARFEHSLERARRESRRLGLLFVDLDRFKEVNDTLGHAVGDQLLKDLAAAMNDRLRGEDTLARLGGDEFVILLEEIVDYGSVEAVLEKFEQIFPWRIPAGATTLEITASIGIALFPDHGLDLPTLMARADAAMYLAKEGGRARHVFAVET